MSFGPDRLGGPYRTIFDVGAFRGDFARECLARWPEAHAYSFEPLEVRPDDVHDHPRWDWFDVALGPTRCVQPINACEFVPSSSFLPMHETHKRAFPYTRQHSVREVPVHMLDDYVSLIEPPSLLKLDVQGYELQVLQGAHYALARFDTVVSEVSHELLYEGQPTFEEIDILLDSRGFQHTARVDELRDPRRRQVLLQSDELWLRR